MFEKWFRMTITYSHIKVHDTHAHTHNYIHKCVYFMSNNQMMTLPCDLYVC